MIEIKYTGRLGNNLIQFLAASILSENTGMPISNPMPSNIVEYLDKPTNIEILREIELSDSGYFDIINSGEFDKNCRYSIPGYCQSEAFVDLFSKRRNILKDPADEKEGVFVHIRLSDILQQGWNLNFEYYDSALKNMDFSEGYISSDTPDYGMIKSLASKYNLKIFSDTPENTIIFGSKFRNKVLSFGTFSWWIGFLGCQDNVVHPDPEKHFAWHGSIFCLENWKIIEY